MANINVRIAALAPPEELDIPRLVQRLNKLQDYYHFHYGGSSQTIGHADLPRRHHSIKKLQETFRTLYPLTPEFRFDIILTGEKVEEGYFTVATDHLGIVSSADTELIRGESGKSPEKFFLYNIIEMLFWLQYGHEHDREEDDIGCLFDSCYYKRSNHVIGLKACVLCENCRRVLIEEGHAPQEQLQAVSSVLKWVKRPPPQVSVKWVVSFLTLIAGAALLFLPETVNVAWISLTVSGWIAALPLGP